MSKTEAVIQLPLEETGVSSAGQLNRQFRWRRLLIVPLAMLLLFTGGVVGMYFQPPGLRAFFAVSGLSPGGGTDTPIAQAIEIVSTQSELAILSEGDVVALGRIIPEGDVMTIAPPYGAGDARVDKVEVVIGQQVEQGQILVVLDSLRQLDVDIESARASLELSRAALIQTQRSVDASLNEATAALARARTGYEDMQTREKRALTLLQQGVNTRSEYDEVKALADKARLDMEQANATLSRFQTPSGTMQSDVAVAQANTQLAESELLRREIDREKAIVRAPVDGTVLNIHVSPGEKPGSEGVLELGNTKSMTVEVEVYQSLIGRVSIGDPVTIMATPLASNLQGVVSAIGWEIGKQSITSDDPAANTDARVVDVIVHLDAESSLLASRFTNLEVVARIDAGKEQ